MQVPTYHQWSERNGFWTASRIAGFSLQCVARLSMFYSLPLIPIFILMLLADFPAFASSPGVVSAIQSVLDVVDYQTQFWLVWLWHFLALLAFCISWLVWPWRPLPVMTYTHNVEEGLDEKP